MAIDDAGQCMACNAQPGSPIRYGEAERFETGVPDRVTGVRRGVHCYKLVLSMIVNQIDIEHIAIREAEDNPPISGNADAPEPFQITFEHVQPVSGQIKRSNGLGGVQTAKNILDPPRLIRVDTAAITAVIKQFQTAMFECPDHFARLYRVSADLSTCLWQKPSCPTPPPVWFCGGG